MKWRVAIVVFYRESDKVRAEESEGSEDGHGEDMLNF